MSSLGMFLFIPLSAEGNGALYAILISKKQSGKNRKAYWKKMLGCWVLYVCVESSVWGRKCSVNGIEIDILLIIYVSLGQ